MGFGPDFYNAIWGGLHRDDYVRDLAAQLVSKGKRILDVGTGCGCLVRRLRELGAEAWGLEQSEYAVENSCCPEFVKLGDVRSIPWPDDSFDLLHSSGLWSYVPERDVPLAVKECYRVACIQQHNYDTEESDNYPEHRFVTVKPRVWWERMLNRSVLVACPVCDAKEYSFGQWIAAVRALEYPYLDVLAVEDSRDMGAFWERWRRWVDLTRIDTGDAPQPKRIALCMEEIRKRFLEGGWYWYLNLESDIIPPPSALKTLLHYGGDLDWAAHIYPDRSTPERPQSGFGCELWARNIILDNPFGDMPIGKTCDAWWWQDRVMPKLSSEGYRVAEFWGLVPLEHRAG